MDTFPTITRRPGWRGWKEEYSKEAVQVASFASGTPLLNPLFTFDPLTFTPPYYLVSQADKETLMAFYKAHKDIPFEWINTQKPDAPITYEVIFVQPPKCQLDRVQDRWKISFIFRQYSPL